jgi:hypothetical protein
MFMRTLTTLTTLVFLIAFSHAGKPFNCSCRVKSTGLEEQQHEGSAEDMDKRSLDGYYVPQRSANWISSRPMKSLNSAAKEDIGYLLQYLEKRSGEFGDDIESERSIRSPLGTMRFSDLKNLYNHVRFRFGKRANPSPLGTMRSFDLKSLYKCVCFRFGKRGQAPLGTMRFGRR